MSFNMSQIYAYGGDDPDSPLRRKTSYDKISLEDFSILKVVRRGAYGKVYKSRYKKDGQLYAIKAMKKDFLIKN